MVFQSYTLFPWLTVAENIAFGPRERGTPVASGGRWREKLMAQVGLTQFADHYPKQLSGGMQQRPRSPGRLPTTPRSCCSTSPSAPSTTRPAR